VKAGLCLAALLISTAAFAQSSSPGPYVIDVRGAMSGLPGGTSFPASAPNTVVPSRGFGIGAGAHVYLRRLGPSRIGIGVDGSRVRGTADTLAIASSSSSSSSASSSATVSTTPVARAAMNLTTVAGQISFNFGSHDGWSYLSAGYGTTRIRSQVSSEVLGPIEHSVTVVTHTSPTINYGGGARWFIRERMAVGFDVRFHRMSNPSKQVVGLSVGMSLR